MMVELTDAEILYLHKWLWSDMQRELGDNPGPSVRIDYKHRWCEAHNLNIPHDCFLCLNAQRYDPKRGYIRKCNQCLVAWPDGNCYSIGFFLYRKISDILDLPTRELDYSTRRTWIRMRDLDVEELRQRMKESDIHDRRTD